jgi:hypothetical protein
MESSARRGIAPPEYRCPKGSLQRLCGAGAIAAFSRTPRNLVHLFHTAKYVFCESGGRARPLGSGFILTALERNQAVIRWT